MDSFWQAAPASKIKTMLKKAALIVFLTFYFSNYSNGFAILSHQAIIDATWDKSIKPLLLKKYPGSSDSLLNVAYTYLYGGAVMPDIGYSPFGSLLFTNLVHYVRSGDFVLALLDESQNLNEYAFSLGLLCHYQADKYGHSLGTNLAVPILFPELKHEHGDVVSYELGRTEHTRVEFGFDVIQTARGNYDLDARQKFVAFKISEEVLERAFLKTYGLKLNDIFGSLTIAVETFRFAVKQLMPALTKNAWRARNASILKLNPLANKKSYSQKLDRKKYKEEFGRPGLKSIFFTLVIGIIPKIGPTGGLKYKEPDEKVDKIFEKCFDAILDHYTESLEQLENKKLKLDNINYDTGKKTVPGEYMHADETYYELLLKNEKNNFEGLSKPLKTDLISYFSDINKLKKYQNKNSKLKRINKAIFQLKETTI